MSKETRRCDVLHTHAAAGAATFTLRPGMIEKLTSCEAKLSAHFVRV